MLPSLTELAEIHIDDLTVRMERDGYRDAEQSAQQILRIRKQWATVREQIFTTTDPMWFSVLKQILEEAPWPHAVLNTIDVYLRKCPSIAETFRLFESNPRSLEILSRLACGSSFLTQTMLDHPEALEDLTLRRRTADMKSREQFLREADEFIQDAKDSSQSLNELRRYQRREILRIGMCDAFGFFDLRYVTLQLSLLADSMVQQCLQIACDAVNYQGEPFAVLALGKHGGEELNYSSDIDLILVANQPDQTAQRIARRMIEGLNQQMAAGFLYRVDMRLRPWGDAGPLVSDVDSYHNYLQNHAELWERQAVLKARIVAGDQAVGRRFLQKTPEMLFGDSREDILTSIRANKQKIERQLTQRGRLSGEVKLGAGSIRDIEFLVQAQQLIHGRKEPRVAAANTLDALVRLAEFSIIDVSSYRQLRESYIFLRSLEHVLQLLHNQQTHRIPEQPEKQEFLARRMDYPNAQALIDRFKEHQAAVRRIFDEHLGEEQKARKTKTQEPIARPAEASAIDSDQRDQLQAMIDEYQSTGQPRVLVHSGYDGSLALRIMLPDQLETATIICGLLLSAQLDIRAAEFLPADVDNRWAIRLPKNAFLCSFLCTSRLDSRQKLPNLEQQLQSLLTELLEAATTDPLDARARLLALFCDAVKASNSRPAHSEIEVHVEQIPDGMTRLKVESEDSFGFLFELTHSLALCGFQMAKASIRCEGDRVIDEFEVRECDVRPSGRNDRPTELKTAVTLIRQFTAWLPSASDPEQAVLRFHHFVQLLLSGASSNEQLQRLFAPAALERLCSVLGFSQYLWQGFLKLDLTTWIPLIVDLTEIDSRPSRTELTQQLNKALQQDELQVALNSFKDDHLFRIELRHVLGRNAEFGDFAEQITELAEVVVTAAFQRAFEIRVREHGKPQLNDGRDCRYSIAGLGKFGGIEMGFGSDIELMVIYEGEGKTDGQHSVSNSQFFDRLVLSLSDNIQASHCGIFAIDLRIRPYGNAGSPAVSYKALETYFGPNGDSWPYERQSLVKLRTVAGHQDFNSDIESLRDRLIYQDAAFDFESFDAVREKQRRQLLKGGQINCKLSDGGLVDCEYSIQALQITFGKQHPKLRTTNTLNAIQAARHLNLIPQSTADSGTAAYILMRQLIDCLRMARGNAKDLTLPDADRPEFTALQRRLSQTYGEFSLGQIEETMNAIRQFAQDIRTLCQVT